MMLVTLMACTKNENPLLVEQNTPFGVPAFDQVKIEHYLPAFEKAIAENEAEIAAIANNPEAPTFANTIEALDRSGELLNKVVGVFFNVIEADGNDEMNAIAEEVSPKLSALSDGIILNDALFQRVKAVYEQRESLGLNDEQMRLLTETFKSFANNGANLPEDKKARLKEINQELGLLSLQFGNNVVAETNAYHIAATAELTAGVEHGEYNLQRRLAGLGLDLHGNAAAIVGNGDGVTGVDGHGDIFAVSGQCLVDGVVHDLVNEVVQTRGRGGTDIHTGALADSFQTFQNLNLLRAVFLCYFGFVRHKFTPVLQNADIYA